jgi:hypothetical protein
MATGDTYQNGIRKNSVGAQYMVTDTTAAAGVAISTPAMAALGLGAQITPYGSSRVSTEPSTLFRDSFDGTTVDASIWTTGGTSAPTQANGSVSLNLTAANSVSSTLISNQKFGDTLGFTLLGTTITLESAKQANPNAHRFFGFGQVTAYASATPVTDGAGFEVDLTGEVNCVVYIAGTRYVINSTSNALISSSAGTGGSGTAVPAGSVVSTFGQTIAWPTNNHRYIILRRGDLIYWYIDSIDVPVGVASYLQPQVATLPIRVASITTPAVSTVLATTFGVGAIAVGDSASGNQIISPTSASWAAPNNATGAGLVASQIVKVAPGNLYRISGYNTGAAAFVQLFDSATLPADTAVPTVVIPVAANAAFLLDYGVFGRKFANGIAMCTSSTAATKTITAAQATMDAQYQ